LRSQHHHEIRVPVADCRGLRLEPCTVSKARELVEKGKAIPRYDETGGFTIQLTYQPRPASARRRSRRQRQRPALCLIQQAPPPARWAGQADWQQLLLDALVHHASNGNGADRFGQLVVIDAEMTCWDAAPPEGQENEIIEIGICVVDVASGDRLIRDRILVQPERSQVSPFCTALTTLTPEQVAGGVPFAEACRMLRERYDTRERVWASYGDYDRRQFEIQCLRRTVEYPFGPSHLNVKSLLATACGLPQDIGMRQAMEALALPIEGTLHRGVDDAWNTGLLLSTLIGRRRAKLMA